VNIKKSKSPFRTTTAKVVLASLGCAATCLVVSFAAHAVLSAREHRLRRRMGFKLYPYPTTTISPKRLPDLLASVDASVEEMVRDASAATTKATVHPARDDDGRDEGNLSTTSIEDDNSTPTERTVAEGSAAASDDEYSTDISEDRTTMMPEENVNDVGSTLRETFHARSLEAKEFFRNLLHEAFPSDTEPTPRYSQYHSQDLYSRTDSNDHSCGQLDAFAGIPIETGNGPWVPPIGSSSESMEIWDAAYRIAMRKIKEVRVGGSKLRGFAEVEVQDLRALRHNLFCGEY
jgi:hypothetical protein